MENSNFLIEIICIAIAGIVLIQYVILIIRVAFFWKNHSKSRQSDLPIVSVLVAARNEEQDLPRLLTSFEKLDYPEEKIEFLIADDQSEDGTLLVLKNWCENRSNRKFFSLKPEVSNQFHGNGKANALAYLSKYAQGDFFFFTDADCRVGPSWIKEGLSSFSPGVGILNGVTEVQATSPFSRFQQIDWWNTLGITKVVSDLGAHTTGLGNNMVISREAYVKSGGFEKIPFSLTEDLEISRLIKNAGFKTQQQVSSGMLLFTKAEKNWDALLKQRKRWVKGAVTLPWIWIICLSFQVLFFPAIFYLISQNLTMGLGIWLLKILLQALFLRFISSKAEQRLSWIWLSLYDFYYLLSSSLTILYYFWPSKITWKSRQYP